MDRERLIKLMAMTTSNHDNEALAALRMANGMLTKEKTTWAEVLSASPQTLQIVLERSGYKQQEDWVAPHLKDKVIIDLMFRAVFAQPRSSNEEFWQFMDSIHNRWRTHGNLSQGQYTALKRCYQRTVKTG